MTTPTKKQADKELCAMITPVFRSSYPHIFKAQAPKQGDKLKFSITMLFDKKKDLTGLAPDRKTPRSLKDVIKNAKIAAFGPDKANWPEDLISPVQDGDDPKFADKKGYQGCWVITAKANEDDRPGLVGKDMSPISDPSDFYPGCYAQAYVRTYYNEYMGKKRILFYLDHVQKVADGESFGGKKAIEQVFSPVSSPDEVVETDSDEATPF